MRLYCSNLVIFVCTVARKDIPLVVYTKALAFQGQNHTSLGARDNHFAAAAMSCMYPEHTKVSVQPRQTTTWQHTVTQPQLRPRSLELWGSSTVDDVVNLGAARIEI